MKRRYHHAHTMPASYLRNFLFGVEDSLVSTVGLVSGIAVAQVPKTTVFVTGVILVFVEAFSMGVGSFISDSTTNEYVSKKKVPIIQSLMSSLIMFLSYLIAGAIPLFPYLIFTITQAFYISIALSILTLFIMGGAFALFFKKRFLSHALQTAILGGIAIIVGVVVGQLLM